MLQNAIEDSASDFMAPYTYGQGVAAADFISDLRRDLHFDDDSVVYAAGRDPISAIFQKERNSVQVNAADVEETLANADLPVFMLVHISNDQETNFASVMDAISTFAGEDYVAFAVSSVYERTTAVSARKLQSTSALSNLQSSTAAIYGVRCTSNIMLGLLVSVILSYFVYSGLSGMSRITANDKFWCDENNVPLGHKVELT